jgi:thiol peroxidase
LSEVRLSDFSGKIKLISVTPSLDTPVCDLQARRFNEAALGMSSHVVLLNVSVDLPFAIARFCSATGIERLTVLSDHREVSFGSAYGVLIKENRLLARSVFLIDEHDVIRYIEIVKELAEHPNYEKVLQAVEKLTEGA